MYSFWVRAAVSVAIKSNNSSAIMAYVGWISQRLAEGNAAELHQEVWRRFSMSWGRKRGVHTGYTQNRHIASLKTGHVQIR